MLNDARQCAVDDDGSPDWFWFCGRQSESCRSIYIKNNSHLVWLNDASSYSSEPSNSGKRCDGDPSNCGFYSEVAFYWEGYYYACCGGNQQTDGKLERYYSNEWLSGPKETTSADGRKCTYYTNPCGTKFHEELKDGVMQMVQGECLSCPVGQVVRMIQMPVNNVQTLVEQCVTPCAEGAAFESESSATCVTCAKTHKQGVDSNNVCVRCASDEFFKPNDTECTGTDCCVKKSGQKIISKRSLSWCWRCPADRELWKRCTDGKLGNASAGGDDKDWDKCGVEKGAQNPY